MSCAYICGICCLTACIIWKFKTIFNMFILRKHLVPSHVEMISRRIWVSNCNKPFICIYRHVHVSGMAVDITTHLLYIDSWGLFCLEHYLAVNRFCIETLPSKRVIHNDKKCVISYSGMKVAHIVGFFVKMFK